jgi:pyruvate carboxylase
MGSDIYFHGLREGETCEIKIAEGKTLIIKLLKVTKVNNEGFRTLIFEVNGNRREIKIKDKTAKTTAVADALQMADPDNPLEIGSSIPGTVLKVLVQPGDEIKENDNLIVIEAMKMETIITATTSGTVKSVKVSEGQQVKSGELLIELK